MNKLASFAMNRSPKIYLTRSDDKLIDFLSSDSVLDVLEVMSGVVWSKALVKDPNV